MKGKALEYVLAKYPGHSAKIMDLYSKDGDFRILCEDYLTIAQAIEQFRLNVIENNEYKSEFVQVYHDLEKEINQLLERQDR